MMFGRLRKTFTRMSDTLQFPISIHIFPTQKLSSLSTMRLATWHLRNMLSYLNGWISERGESNAWCGMEYLEIRQRNLWYFPLCPDKQKEWRSFSRNANFGRQTFALINRVNVVKQVVAAAAVLSRTNQTLKVKKVCWKMQSLRRAITSYFTPKSIANLFYRKLLGSRKTIRKQFHSQQLVSMLGSASFIWIVSKRSNWKLRGICYENLPITSKSSRFSCHIQ